MENEKFGKFFQEQRNARGFTQEQIGNMLNVTDKAVSRWERGECYPEITQLPKIAEMFGLTVDELLSGQSKPRKLLRMCGHCRNQKCKKENYSLLPYCENSFHWAVYGIGVAALFVLMTVTYLIVRIIDGNWAEWRFPVIMAVTYVAVVVAAAMIFSLKDVKAEMKGGGERPQEQEKKS